MSEVAVFVVLFVVTVLIISGAVVAFMMYRKTLREAKNYER